jgi:uncharacterized membrane protein YccC
VGQAFVAWSTLLVVTPILSHDAAEFKTAELMRVARAAGALTLTFMVSLLTRLNVGQAWLNIAYGLILLGALLLATPRASRR